MTYKLSICFMQNNIFNNGHPNLPQDVTDKFYNQIIPESVAVATITSMFVTGILQCV